jgi:hypothetical protein
VTIPTRDNSSLNDRNHAFNKVVDDRTCLFNSCAGANEPSRQIVSVLAALHPIA